MGVSESRHLLSTTTRQRGGLNAVANNTHFPEELLLSSSDSSSLSASACLRALSAAVSIWTQERSWCKEHKKHNLVRLKLLLAHLNLKLHHNPTSCSWVMSASIALDLRSDSLAEAMVSFWAARESSSSLWRSFTWPCDESQADVAGVQMVFRTLRASHPRQGYMYMLTWILRSCFMASSRPLLVASSWSSMFFNSPSSFFFPADARPRCFLSSSSSASSSRTWQRNRWRLYDYNLKKDPDAF